MKRKIFILLLIFTLIPAVSFAAETVEFTLTGYCDYTSAYEILDMVNAEREAEGLHPLSMNKTLLDAAMQRAAEIAFSYYPAHFRPDGTDWRTVIEDFPANSKGENIAAGHKDSESVMNAWMDSEGHRENILTDYYNTMGIGVFYQRDIGRYTWVQIFTSSTDGGYVMSGKSEKKFTITTLPDRFNDTVAYNPLVSDDGFAYYTHICPGKTEEFGIVEMESYEYGLYPTAIPDMDNFSFRALTDNITVNGRDVTVVSEGDAELGIYIGNVHIGTHTFKAEHYWYEYGFEATCTEPGHRSGICIACEYEVTFETTPALGHDVIIIPAVEPTCEDWGKTEGSYCGRCDITLVGQENVRNLGHKYVNTEIPATCTEYGKICTTCEVCDFYMESEGQSPLGHWWGDPCDDENYDRISQCETCGFKEVYKKGYERLNSDVKSLMNVELKPTHEERVMRYKAIYDKFSDEYKAEFLYEKELTDMVRCFEFFHMGDADFDGKIGAEDLSYILSWYGRQNTSYDITGDDSIINSDDLSMLLSNYGKII